MKKTTSDKDWEAFDAMSEEDVHQAAINDPDAQPLTEASMKHMRRTPQVKVIRRALRMTQEEFAAAYQIAIGTLRDWEQNRSVPDMAAKAYLKVIAREPEMTRRALEASAPIAARGR
jgi:putative transcriptional regulator